MKRAKLRAYVALFYLVAASDAGAAPFISGVYYDDTIQGVCPAANFCKVAFSRVPTAKFLNIKSFSCNLNGKLASMHYARLSTAATATGVGTRFVPVGSISIVNGLTTALEADNTVSFNQPTEFKISPLQYPQIVFRQNVAPSASPSTFAYVCTISGALSTS